MIHDDLKNELKDAMRAKEKTRVEVIRAILTAFTNELITQKQKPDDVLDDKSALEVIKRQAKQRKDSIEQFEKGGRDDLAVVEKEELVLIEKYLPEQMPEEEIRKIAEAKKEEMGITDKSKMGILMGAIMKETSGSADGNTVKTIVESLF